MPGEADSPVEEGERDGAPVAAAVDDGPAASIEPAAADRSEKALNPPARCRGRVLEHSLAACVSS